MQHDTDELQSFLRNKDYSLFVRRVLDKSLDRGDSNLISDAIELSREFRRMNGEEGTGLVQQFDASARTLLQRLSAEGEQYFRSSLLLEADSISKRYSRSSFTLQPISLSLSTGEILGVVGENGNGKTTMLRCLAGQLAIDSGSLTFTQLVKPDHYSIKHHVAFIPQRIPRWYGMLQDNLHFSASVAGVRGKQNIEMVHFMLERLNLLPYAHLNWQQISSGYRTRFEIARVLLQKPSLLILDEPLANLDINAQQIMLTDLRYLAKSLHHPMGIVLSSQQLHEVEKIADTVLFIKDGSCLFRTGEANTATHFVVEVECKWPREQFTRVFGGQAQVQYNGGFYTVTSVTLTPQNIIRHLLDAGIEVQYFRDITHSTKRFF